MLFRKWIRGGWDGMDFDFEFDVDILEASEFLSRYWLYRPMGSQWFKQDL